MKRINLVKYPKSVKKKNPVRSETEHLLQQLRKSINAKNEEFKKALEGSRPSLDSERATRAFSIVSTKTSKKLAKIILKYVSLNTSIGYARLMVEQDVLGDGVDFDDQIALVIGRKIAKIEATKVILEHFKVPQEEATIIVQMMTEREFRLVPKLVAPSNNSNSNPEMKDILRSMTDLANAVVDR